MCANQHPTVPKVEATWDGPSPPLSPDKQASATATRKNFQEKPQVLLF